MLTICLQENKSLIITRPVKIFERECNVDFIRWLIPTQYTESNQVKNLADYIITVKIKCPDGRTWCEQLKPEETLYKDRLDVRQQITSDFTQVAGNVQMYLTFAKVVEQTDGTKKGDIFHTEDVIVEVSAKEEFIFIPDKSLQAVDQIILELADKINQVENMVDSINDDKAEDIEIIDGEIWLVRYDENGEPIKLGDPISAKSHVWSEM